MFHRCSDEGIAFNQSRVYFALGECHTMNSWSIDHWDTFEWKLVKDRSISQTFGSCYLIGKRTAAWIGRVSSGLHVDTTDSNWENHPKQNNQKLRCCEITSLCGEIYFQRGKKVHTQLWWCHPHPDTMDSSHGAFAINGKSSTLVARWLESKPTWSHPSWEQKASSFLFFFLAQRLFDIATRLLLCSQAQPWVLSWTLRDPAERCGSKIQG